MHKQAFIITVRVMLQKLYAVCDVALKILSAKKVQSGLSKLPIEPVLPTRLFTKPSTVSYISFTKVYRFFKVYCCSRSNTPRVILH